MTDVVQLLVAKHSGDPDAEEWTAFAQIGERFGGETLTLEEYARVEQLYVGFVLRLMDLCGTRALIVAEPRVASALPAWLPEFRNGTELGVTSIVPLLRGMLRGSGTGCVFEVPGGAVRVGVAFDFYLTVEVAEDLRQLVERALPAGLRILREQEPTCDELITRPADDDFWLALREWAAGSPSGIWILEQWAYGPWGERWYRARADQLHVVRRAMRANSAVRSGSDLDVEVLDLRSYFDEFAEMPVEPPEIRMFDHPARQAELFARPFSIEAVQESIRKGPGTVGLFNPEKFFDAPSPLAAVVPNAAGSLTARWLR
ncbi:hypothetical protein [Paractinoplanes toevensis]|uniref:Uncharacterized protein n=1 Tax=Paractinoplanes toevensis TaxID=571911 RepID=A0A919TE50_9ACTN|nr:hypothetical protein [Actinoplanes toevensis]GIM93652.1 hypothetical protein Ato02nite_054450 [Actinoplanes toevensis]